MNSTKIRPTDARNFGLVLAVIAFYFAIFRVKNHSGSESILALGVFLVMVALARPQWLYPFFSVWIYLGKGLHFLNTRILFSILYFIVLTPVGFILRRRNWDPLDNRFDPLAQSYRKLNPHNPMATIERPF